MLSKNRWTPQLQTHQCGEHLLVYCIYPRGTQYSRLKCVHMVGPYPYVLPQGQGSCRIEAKRNKEHHMIGDNQNRFWLWGLRSVYLKNSVLYSFSNLEMYRMKHTTWHFLSVAFTRCGQLRFHGVTFSIAEWYEKGAICRHAYGTLHLHFWAGSDDRDNNNIYQIKCKFCTS